MALLTPMGDNLRGSGASRYESTHASGGSSCATVEAFWSWVPSAQTTPKESDRVEAFRGISELIDVGVV